MSVMSNIVEGLIKSVALNQLKTALPAVGSGIAVLGATNHVSPLQFEGALYYLASSMFYLVPALLDYLKHHAITDLITSAIAATPGSPEAAAIQAKVN